MVYVAFSLQVFLSQLFRRARLVNPAFQRSVADVVWRHAAVHAADTGAAGAEADATARERSTSLYSLTGSVASVWAAAERAAQRADTSTCVVDCVFAGLIGLGPVEVWAAPIKTMARMREKIVECVFTPLSII